MGIEVKIGATSKSKQAKACPMLMYKKKKVFAARTYEKRKMPNQRKYPQLIHPTKEEGEIKYGEEKERRREGSPGVPPQKR